ncbi:MAG: hypothetical protein FWE45_01860 [Firmicutes bacterium]|nr:hypothetical protein [Bacillota bacterium]
MYSRFEKGNTITMPSGYLGRVVSSKFCENRRCFVYVIKPIGKMDQIPEVEFREDEIDALGWYPDNDQPTYGRVECERNSESYY